MNSYFSKLTNYISYIIFIGLILSSGCSKSGNSSTPKSTTLAIASLSATSGPYNSQITVTGTNFGYNPADNKFFFNGKPAIVYQSSSNKLIVLVPLNAGTGQVSITVNGVTATGPIFTYQTAEVLLTLAGNDIAGFVNNTGTLSTFNYPNGLAVDAAGNVYVADAENNAIRKITPAGVVSTFAGSANGDPGDVDGMGTAATFLDPTDIAIDALGNLYVTDTGNLCIRKITPAGQVSTFAGSRYNLNSNDGTGTAAGFGAPSGLAIDASGNIYVADLTNAEIRKITPAAVVTTFAGKRSNPVMDGTGVMAGFSAPFKIALDRSGNLYVTDQGISNSIRKITPSAVVTTVAGGEQVSANGNISNSIGNPFGIAIDANNNIYVCDGMYGLIKMVTPSGVVTTFVGGSITMSLDGPLSTAELSYPRGITIDGSGNFYITDSNRIRKIGIY